MYLVISKDGYRLCQDTRWRDFASYGTHSACVKEYRRKSAAITRAKRIGGSVAQIPADASVDASGKVIQRTPASDHPGFERVSHSELHEYVCWPNPNWKNARSCIQSKPSVNLE
jgi:hypothetical protein